MQFILSPRGWFFVMAWICAALLGYALYVQHAEFLDPCPLCVFQRVAILWMGVVSLAAAIHNPGRKGQWTYAALVGLGGLAGMGVAGRHVWLQNLPPDQVPECGMGLNYMIETMPFLEVLREVFYGSGECAEVLWTFLGLSMPSWTLICFVLMTIMTCLVMVRAKARRA